MRFVLGVDEAGRGPLAGPVAVGVVAVAEDFDILASFPGVNDSKKLTEKAREKLFLLLEDFVERGMVNYHVELVSANHIDTKGLTHAVRFGVERGVRKLLQDPSEGRVYLDGLLKAPDEYEQETVIKGDSLIPAIMLASVAAKVTRDRYMAELARDYPEYGFEKHKGYGTKDHYAAITKFGPSEIHRQLFLRKFLRTT
jgi:ribonuclease HII